ncbi:hypothetical protein ACFE04_030160 [Oxalis oulophora]
MGGCMSSKAEPRIEEDSPRERLQRKGAVDSRVSHASSSKRNETELLEEKSDGGDHGVKSMLIGEKVHGSSRYYVDQIELQAETIADQIAVKKKNEDQIAATITKAPEIQQAGVAIWPTWLASVAGEALKGWSPRRASTFEKLEKIGQGTYSTVYKARDLTNDKIVALKKVRFDHYDIESIKFMAREILILRRLDHPNIIKLEGLITSPLSSSLYLVFEYMEHDLVGLSSLPGVKFTEPQIKCYMRQLISGLHHCHSRGILHRDIKGSNLLIDSNGILKIADFGLASFFDPHYGTPLTSRVVTLWYRPPELLLGASHYGVAVDLWSTGCILGELYAGRPILPGKTEVEQIHKIFKLCGSPSDDYWMKLQLPHSTVFKPVHPYKRCLAEIYKHFPDPALRLLETLLSMDPSHRGTAALALKSEFFMTKPLACDPSSLPKYPPCKEIDAKLRDEEARRVRAVGHIDQKADREKMQLRDPLIIQAPTANIMLDERHSNLRSRSQMLGSHKKESHSGLLIDPPSRTQVLKGASQDFSELQHKRVSKSGVLVHGAEWLKDRNLQYEHVAASSSKSNNMTTVSDLLLTRKLSEAGREKPGPSRPQSLSQSGSFNAAEVVLKQDQRTHMQITGSPQTGVGSSIKEPTLHSHGPRGNKIYVSGPLLGPTNNMDQMLKEHDRKIQEYARRARLDKTKPQGQGKQLVDNPGKRKNRKKPRFLSSGGLAGLKNQQTKCKSACTVQFFSFSIASSLLGYKILCSFKKATHGFLFFPAIVD